MRKFKKLSGKRVSWSLFQQSSCSKTVLNNKLEKKNYTVDKRFNKVAALNCAVCTAILPKTKLALALPEVVLKILMHLWENLLGDSLFSVNLQVQSLLCDFIKNRFHCRGFPTWVLQGSSFLNFWKVFCKICL